MKYVPFYKLFVDLENKIESQFDISLWGTDEKKFKKRVEEWNNY